jgi:hypothetical protein
MHGYCGALTLPGSSYTMTEVGRLAQRLERSVYTRKVEGSNPSVPTNLESKKSSFA